jgi:hypothetical protein
MTTTIPAGGTQTYLPLYDRLANGPERQRLGHSEQL